MSVAVTQAIVLTPVPGGAGELLAAIRESNTGIMRDERAPAPDPRGIGMRPACTCRAAAAEAAGAGDRIRALLEAAMASLLAAGAPEPGARLHLVLPPADTPRGRAQDPDALRAHLSAEPAIEDLAPVVEHQQGPVAAHLAAACQALAGGEADEIVFGAADSLLDPDTLAQLARRGLLETGEGTGVVPGEAAVLLRLRRAGPHGEAPRLAGLAAGPGAGSGSRGKARHPLARALHRATGGTGPDAVVHPAGTRRRYLLDWHQVRNELWPPAPPGDHVGPPAPEPETLELGLAVGETGAAALPLGLALACARLGTEDPAPARLAVACEWTDEGEHAAVAVAAAPAGDRGEPS